MTNTQDIPMQRRLLCYCIDARNRQVTENAATPVWTMRRHINRRAWYRVGCEVRRFCVGPEEAAT